MLKVIFKNMARIVKAALRKSHHLLRCQVVFTTTDTTVTITAITI